MGFYKWAMRRGSVILFLASAFISLIGLAHAMFATRNTASPNIGGALASDKLASLLLFLSSAFDALALASIPFIGAVIINRWDRQNSPEGH